MLDGDGRRQAYYMIGRFVRAIVRRAVSQFFSTASEVDIRGILGLSTDRKEAKRAKATRLAAVHVASESGIPADRGNFGA